MRLDLVIPNEGAFALEAVRNAPWAEELGYRGLWLTDHVVGFQFFQPVYGAYWLEALSALAFAAANTKKIRLGIGVLVIPYRDAVYTAKALATIDQLSNGRVDLGVGTGWSKAEFYTLGRGELFEARGPYTSEALDVMQCCWQGGEIAFEGKFHNFRKVQFEPTPVQKPRIPFWIGARGDALAPLRRAAKYADVWHPTQIGVDELKEASKRLNELAGREIPISIRIRYEAGAGMDEILKGLEAYKNAGCIEAAADIKAGSFDEFRKVAEHLAKRAAETGLAQ